jgi:hypothetical protein
MLALRRLAIALSAACLVSLGAAAGAFAGPDDTAQIVPLGLKIDHAPVPVLGADGRNHLVYEITIVNQTAGSVTIQSVQARQGRRRIGASLEGDELASMLRVNGSEGPVIPGGGSALLFMDVKYPRGARRPMRLEHSLAMSFDNPPQAVQQFAFTGVPTNVSRSRPIAVRPPLRGPNWIAANGCCAPINAHRGATLSIDGTVRVPERFAIDWVQLDGQDLLFQGAISDLSNWGYFGARIHAALPGRVVSILDDLPEQVPGALPEGQTVQTAGGNHMVIRFGPQRYAFYAHMQPGSLRFRLGDRVRTGQVLGLLGNTGNTDGPHLHFHIMDGPSPLQSNGLPFVHPRFSSRGMLTNLPGVSAGQVAQISDSGLAGSFMRSMPLNDQVVGFGR